MPDKTTDNKAARQITLAVTQLDSFTVLPSVTAALFPKLTQPQFSSSDVAEIIESAPALAANILSLAHQQGISIEDENFSIRRALGRLPAKLIRDTLLSAKTAAILEAEPDIDTNTAALRKELILHSLAVACCAKGIAQVLTPQTNPQLAYLAGLLHDIGKLALLEVMPKSLARITEEAESQNASTTVIEQKHLGLDHAILGKRLAQKWHLPEQLSLAVWLHHSDTTAIVQTMPQAKIAQIVQLADIIARKDGIGYSGSYDTPYSTILAKSLGLEEENLQQISEALAEQVEQKAKVLGLDLPAVPAEFYNSVYNTAVGLIGENAKLSEQNQKLQTDSGHFEFVKEFLMSIDSNATPIDIAANFATRWQKFYQTGMVCLYLAPANEEQTVEAIVVENLSQSKVVLLNTPENSPPIPKAAEKFEILNAYEHIDWLFEQLDVDFDRNYTKLVPICCGGKVIAAIVFELRYPGDVELFRGKFEAATAIAGCILDIASTSSDRERFAERFAQILSSPKPAQQQPDPENSFEALVEMAAGAAHELNNPLSVISGRTQMLAQSETDPEKKQTLKLIQQNTNKTARIVKDLMSFAKPQEPRATQTNIKQILDEAEQLASQKTGKEKLDIDIDIEGADKNVFVDSAQIASAIANIFSNCVQSYPNGVGPVKVTAESCGTGDTVKLTIADEGCGMDSETLRKAKLPFYSSKPAGRKRGMGLAQAQRIIESNEGCLNITSQPDTGTTVKITLPCR